MPRSGDDAVASHSLSLVQAAVAAAEAELKLAAYDAAGRPAPRSPRRSAPPSPTAGAAAGAAAGFERGAGRSSGHAAPTAQLTLSALGRDGVELTIVHGSTVDEVTAASKPNTTDQPATAGQPSSVRLTGRHAEILTLLAWHQGAATFGRSVAASGWSAARPTAAAGLSADALAVALLGEDARPVTLRAEVSRLRHALAASGAGIALESRPYRLEPTPVCDARRVLELIGRGRYRAALELYRGPILPASTAPGIEAIRAEVSGALREAMLSDAGPEVLMTYLALHEAHDDVAAWRTALAVLPPRSPRRAVVVSHLETLEAYGEAQSSRTHSPRAASARLQRWCNLPGRSVGTVQQARPGRPAGHTLQDTHCRTHPA
ncbi:helix-turn-helix domain-containing protein [Brevibacterium litoralis]|uniref:helix-turn-helix domain-containing protein n=1 Tax=Brevibacterium litoralis TaxID=3138935 RepID=UPI0032EDEAC5